MNSKIRYFLISLGVFLLACATSLGGFYIGGRLFYANAEGKFALWLPLGRPPEKAISITKLVPDGANPFVQVFVATKSGRIYQQSTAKLNGWVEGKLPDHLSYGAGHNCDMVLKAAFNSYFGSLPSKPVECATMVWSMEWIADDTFVVLLEDGSVWWWHYSTSFDKYALFYCGCPTLGASLVLVPLAILWRRRQKQITRSQQNGGVF